MKTEKNTVDFFLGSNSPDGFYSLYSELTRPEQGKRLYLIKGTAGSGKSSMMRRVAEELAGREELVERIHCSSDPDSLDGVILHSGKAAILDATPPHVVEPAYPGGYESVVNIVGCLDETLLEERLPEIVSLQEANGDCHKKCRGLMKCADILLSDNARFVEECTDFKKLAGFAERFAKKEWRSTGAPGEERKRMLSAVTNQGLLTYTGTVKALCPRVVMLRDEYGVASNALLQYLRRLALDAGQLVYSCWCPLSPQGRLCHLLLPKLGLAIVTSGRFVTMEELLPDKVIHFTRFTDMEKLWERRQYLRFNRKAAAELIEAAVERLRQAKRIHDLLEGQYYAAVDFERVTALADDLLARLAARE